jgi:hypothetical protein
MCGMLNPMLDEVAAAINAVAATMRRMPSEIRARFWAEAQRRSLLRARFRAEAEERKLDELLNRISDDGKTPDQDDGDTKGIGEDRGPLPTRIDPLFGVLIGVLAVCVLFAMLALLPR